MDNSNNTQKRIIVCENAPKAIGPYSQGVNINDFYYFSGQIPLDPTTMQLVESDIAIQTKQVIANIDAMLKNEGLTADNVVKSTVFLTDLSNFDAMNAIYATYFTTNQPARSCIEVSALPKGSLVEIEIIAHK